MMRVDDGRRHTDAGRCGCGGHDSGSVLLGTPGAAPNAVRLLERLRAGERPLETWAWLQAAAVRHLNHGVRLEDAFELGSSARRRARDAAMVRAERLLNPRSLGMSMEARARSLEKAIAYFEQRCLPRLRRGELLDLEPFEVELWDAATLEVAFVGSLRQLRDILEASAKIPVDSAGDP